MTTYQTFFNVDPQSYFNQNYHLIENLIKEDADNVGNLIYEKIGELAKRYCAAYTVQEEGEYRDIFEMFKQFHIDNNEV